LQWAKDIKSTLLNFKQHLKPNGKIFITCPGQVTTGSIFTRVLSEIIQTDKWKPFFINWISRDPRYFFHKIDDFSKEELGLIINSLELRYVKAIFPSKEALSKFISNWLPELEYLETQIMKDDFMNDLLLVYEKYCKIVLKQNCVLDDGRIIFYNYYTFVEYTNLE